MSSIAHISSISLILKGDEDKASSVKSGLTLAASICALSEPIARYHLLLKSRKQLKEQQNRLGIQPPPNPHVGGHAQRAMRRETHQLSREATTLADTLRQIEQFSNPSSMNPELTRDLNLTLDSIEKKLHDKILMILSGLQVGAASTALSGASGELAKKQWSSIVNLIGSSVNSLVFFNSARLAYHDIKKIHTQRQEHGSHSQEDQQQLMRKKILMAASLLGGLLSIGISLANTAIGVKYQYQDHLDKDREKSIQEKLNLAESIYAITFCTLTALSACFCATASKDESSISSGERPHSNSMPQNAHGLSNISEYSSNWDSESLSSSRRHSTGSMQAPSTSSSGDLEHLTRLETHSAASFSDHGSVDDSEERVFHQSTNTQEPKQEKDIIVEDL